MSLLKAIAAVRSSFERPPPIPKLPLRGQRISLIYLFDGMGDAALLAPVVQALIEAGARTPVGLVVPPLAARVLRRTDLKVRLHVVPSLVLDVEREVASGVRKRTSPAARRARSEVEQALAKARYDVAVDLSLRPGLDSRRWLRASGADRRLGWLADDETAEAVGLSWGAPDVRRLVDRHWSRAMMLLLAPFGVTEPSAEVTFTDTARGRRRAAALWGSHPRVLVVPGSRSADKRWSSDAFVEVLERAGAGSVVVAGAPSERALAEGVAARVSGKVYCGKDLAALVALIRGADAVLANDTGPMHLAFLCNRPCVAIFTQMSPVSWGPLDPGPHRVVQTTGADGEIDQVAAALAELLGSAVEG